MSIAFLLRCHAIYRAKRDLRSIPTLLGIAVAAGMLLWMAIGRHSANRPTWLDLLGAGVTVWMYGRIWFETPADPLGLAARESAVLGPAPLPRWMIGGFTLLTRQPLLLLSALTIAVASRPFGPRDLGSRLVIGWVLGLTLVAHRAFVSRFLTRGEGGAVVAVVKWAARGGVVAAAVLVGWLLLLRVTDATGHAVTFSAAIRAGTLLRGLAAPSFAYLGLVPITGGVMIWLGAHLIALGVLVSRPGLTRLSSTTRFSVLWRRGRVNAILARWEAAGPSALMWKNVRTVLRTQPLQRFVPCAVAAPVLAAVTALPQFHQASGFAAGISTAWLALLVVTGSMFVRNDLRLDLPSLAVIVAAPVPIRRVAAAEVMASTLVLTACQAGCGTLLIGALLFRSDLPTPRLVIAAAWLMILPMLPALNSSMLASQNLLAIRVPRLVRLGMRRPGEVGSTGLAYLAMLATAAAFVAVAILPLLGAVIVLGVTHGAGAEIRYVVSYATAVMLAWAQARLAVHVLGGQLERRAMTLCEA